LKEETEKIKVEKKEENQAPENGITFSFFFTWFVLNFKGNPGQNGIPKLTRKKTAPKINLKKPEDLKDIEIGDLNDPEYIRDLLLLYQRHEQILKMAIARVIMFLIEKYRSIYWFLRVLTFLLDQNQKDNGEIEHTRSMLGEEH